MPDGVLAGLYGLWFGLSVAVQIPALRPWIRRFDLFVLVPEWRFFAPVPAQHDIHVVFRDRYADGTVGEWTETGPTRFRPWWAFLFNPGKRANKAVIDAFVEFARVKESEPQVLQVSVPYLTFLNLVSRIPRSVPSSGVQFMLVRTGWETEGGDVGVLFVSEIHDL